MIGRNGACGFGGLDEAGPTGKCSRVLDRSDELALMGINSSSSGTLVLVPDKTIPNHVNIRRLFYPVI